MEACDTRMKIQHERSGVVFLFQDDLDFYAVPDVQEIVMAAIDRYPVGRIELDLVQVEHVDSAGLWLIASLLKSSRASGRLSAVVAEGSQPQRILRQSMFDTLFPVKTVNPALST